MPRRPNPAGQPVRTGIAMVAILTLAGCSSNPVDTPPPTIPPASAAVSPAVTESPAGEVLPMNAPGRAALFDASTRTLVVLTGAAITTFSPSGTQHSTRLPEAATALAGDGDGTVYLSARGGYYRFDVADPALTRVDVEGAQATEFTAIARRADGKLVLGSVDGAVYTLSSEAAVGARLEIFARVDSLVTQGDITVVLDRGQTSVTTIDTSGTEAQHALRAGEGATTLATDGAGRVLVADTRGESLLVFGVDPLILRQRYPVLGAPYGLAGSSALTWVSQTATNTVIGYDLATGIPVEKVRYRTVQQPDSLALDDSSDTLYVVSGSGAGVQVIADAAEGA